MHPERFRPLLTANGPFASIYVDDSHDAPNSTARLEVTCRHVRRELERHGAQPGLISVVENAVLQTHPPVGGSGRMLIATAEAVIIDEHLPRPDSPTVRLSELPYFLPLVRHGVDAPTYLVVAVDHIGADITVHRDHTVSSETVQAGGYPVHKAERADKGHYGEAQQRVDEMIRKNTRAVADRVTEIFDDRKVEEVFVVGEPDSRARLLSALPARITGHSAELHGTRGDGARPDEIRRAINAEFERRRLAGTDAAVQRIRAAEGRKSGLGVEGLTAVCAALRDGAVETLLIGDLADQTVVADDRLSTIAPTPDVLSELGTAPTRTLRADEALPLAAVSVDASIVCDEQRVDLADGVAAVLRYVDSNT
jgi:peptide chain release factor subunit 1